MAKNIVIKNLSNGKWFHHAVGRGGDIHRRYGLWIIGGSTNCVNSSFYKRGWRSFDFYNLSHFLEGSGRCAFQEEGGDRQLKPGECIVVTPGVVHIYGCDSDSFYMEDTLKFQGPVADMLFDSGVLRSGVYPLGMIRKVREIAEAARDPSVSAQINANGALQQLLIEMYNANRMRSSGGNLLDGVLDAIKHAPERWWTVEELAELAGMSTGQLRRSFLHNTGVLPKGYIEQFKMHRAAELLHNGGSIAVVAQSLGYRDVYHFARRFKMRFGVPPGRFRKEHSGQ